MKALKILNGRLKELKGASKIVRMDNSHLKFDKPIKYIEEAIKELEEYENDMDRYLDYTTGSRCSKSFGSSLPFINKAYNDSLHQILINCDVFEECKLVKLEKVISNYYLAKGYQVGVAGWDFDINISSSYEKKNMVISFLENNKWEIILEIKTKTTKEMFDKAFEYFTLSKKETDVK